MLSKLSGPLTCITCLLFLTNCLTAQETAKQQEKTVQIELSGGRLKMQVPSSWNVVEPKFSMIEAEYRIEKQGDDENDARLTVMPAGGSVDANIQRWAGQFSQPDGKTTSDVMKRSEIKIDGMVTHMIDVSGTFADRPGGPVSPPIMRENYRMLAAIIETDEDSSYFIKFYGGKASVDANAKRFDAFVKSLKVRD